MRRSQSQKSNQSLAALLAFSLAGLAAGFFGPHPAVGAADMAPSSSTADPISQSLRQIFNGGSPTGVSDLRAMQLHVRQLSDQVKKCTVGVQVGAAWGSGVIISKDGYVLTAAHVAGKPNQRCKFTMADGTELDGTTLGMFRTLDAGLMKITHPGEYPFAELGDSSPTKLREGQWCVAMGHPGGYQSGAAPCYG